MTTMNQHHQAVPVAGARRRGERGFSFIEILIVMGIIAVLVGMIIVVIQIWARKGPEFLTRQRMIKVASGVSQLHTNYSVYPPLRVKDITKAFMVDGGKIKPARNNTNEGIETLVQALYWKGFSFDPQLQDDEFINTDEDELGLPIGKRGTPELFEIRDEWENPLIYIPASAYGKLDESPAIYTDSKGQDWDVRPWKSELGGFQQPDSFQLFSMGPDGEPNTEDDLLHWKK